MRKKLWPGWRLNEKITLNLEAMSRLYTQNGRVFENEFMKLEMKDDILYGWYKDILITLEIAKQVVSIRLEFASNRPVLMLAAERGVKGFTREARQYLSSEEGLYGVLAGSIVTKRAFSSHLANFFIQVSMNKPIVPIRAFSSTNEALTWLRKIESEMKADRI